MRQGSPPDCSLVHALDVLCPSCFLRPHGRPDGAARADVETYCKICVDMITACVANKTPPPRSGSSTVHVVTRATSCGLPHSRHGSSSHKDRAAEQERGAVQWAFRWKGRSLFFVGHTLKWRDRLCRRLPWLAAALAHRTPHRPSHLPTPHPIAPVEGERLPKEAS